MLFALLLTPILIMLGLVVDIGFGTVAKRTEQNFADATALAATQAIADNTTITPVSGTDVYNAISDVITATGVASGSFAITAPSRVGSTVGQVYVVAQFIDASGTPLTPAAYVTNNALPISTSASGVKMTVTTVKNTYFAPIIHVPTLTVSASAAAVGKHVFPAGVAGLNPYAARWDPPFGGDTATLYASMVGATQGCSPPVYTGYQCYYQGGLVGSMSHPLVYGTNSLIWWAINQGHTTTFTLYGNQWQGDNVGGAGEKDWNSNSAAFKGFFNDGLTNNCLAPGNQGNGQGLARGRAPNVNAKSVGYFPLMDYGAGNGRNFAGTLYGVIALYVTGSGTDPMYGTVVPQTGSWKPDTSCGATVIDPTGQSQFVAPFLIS